MREIMKRILIYGRSVASLQLFKPVYAGKRRVAASVCVRADNLGLPALRPVATF